MKLKLIASQDVGGRDADLFDSILVDDHEAADLVSEVLSEALAETPGAQAITDRVAEAIPRLRDPDLAKASTRLILTTILRAYQAGARAARRAIEARGQVDEDRLRELAAESREQARVEDQSRRLFLTHIHALYCFPGTGRRFLDTFRRYPLPVLRQAEQALRGQMHRDDIRSLRTYFAAIVRNHNEVYHQRRLRQGRETELRAQLRKDRDQREEQLSLWDADPVRGLEDGLRMLVPWWRPEKARLLFGGVGPGRGQLW